LHHVHLRLGGRDTGGRGQFRDSRGDKPRLHLPREFFRPLDADLAHRLRRADPERRLHHPRDADGSCGSPETCGSLHNGDLRRTGFPRSAADIETAGVEILQNVYETLVWYEPGVENVTVLVPRLAMEVPTAANGGISPDGKNYTFTIRPDVKFHSGKVLSSDDVV